MKTRKLRICGREWTIKFQPHAISAARCCYGTTDDAALEMVVSTDKTHPTQVRSSALHELLHASIRTVLGAYPDDEETLVRGLECALYDAFRSNPWFVDYLMEKDDGKPAAK